MLANNSYICVSSTKSYDDALIIVLRLNSKGFNTTLYHDIENKMYEVQVLQFTNKRISLEETLMDLKMIGYAGAYIVENSK